MRGGDWEEGRGRGLRVHNGNKDDFNTFYTCVKLSKMSFPRRRHLGRGDELVLQRGEPEMPGNQWKR